MHYFFNVVVNVHVGNLRINCHSINTRLEESVNIIIVNVLFFVVTRGKIAWMQVPFNHKPRD
jgi:hypothetical protein